MVHDEWWNWQLEKKDKYTKRDLFELLSHTFYKCYPNNWYPWCKKAASSDEVAEKEFEKCKEFYTRILKEMNENLPKGLPVLLGGSCSSMGAGYTNSHYYYPEWGRGSGGYSVSAGLNDGMSTD